MLRFIMSILISIVLAGAIHELGHYAAAFCYGQRLKYYFGWSCLWKIPIPRFLWRMPDIKVIDQRIIASAGFGCEVFMGFPLLHFGITWYPAIVLMHLMLYPFYAGDASDMKWFYKEF